MNERDGIQNQMMSRRSSGYMILSISLVVQIDPGLPCFVSSRALFTSSLFIYSKSRGYKALSIPRVQRDTSYQSTDSWPLSLVFFFNIWYH